MEPSLVCPEDKKLKMQDTIMCDSRRSVKESSCYGCNGPIPFTASKVTFRPKKKEEKLICEKCGRNRSTGSASLCRKCYESNEHAVKEITTGAATVEIDSYKNKILELQEQIALYNDKCNQFDKELRNKENIIKKLEKDNEKIINTIKSPEITAKKCSSCGATITGKGKSDLCAPCSVKKQVEESEYIRKVNADGNKYKIILDFVEEPEVLESIKAVAKRDKRTVENELLFLIRECWQFIEATELDDLVGDYLYSLSSKLIKVVDIKLETMKEKKR